MGLLIAKIIGEGYIESKQGNLIGLKNLRGIHR
jgi:hypothetical protein